MEKYKLNEVSLRNLENLDLIVLILLAAISLLVGKYIITSYGYSFWGFNLATCGILIVGEIIWFLLKRRMK